MRYAALATHYYYFEGYLRAPECHVSMLLDHQMNEYVTKMCIESYKRACSGILIQRCSDLKQGTKSDWKE
jgi:hypothetical protein